MSQRVMRAHHIHIASLSHRTPLPLNPDRCHPIPSRTIISFLQKSSLSPSPFTLFTMLTFSSPYTLPPTTENASLILNEAYRNALTISNLTAHSKATHHWLNVAPHLHCCFCHTTPATFARQFPNADNSWYEKPVHNQSIIICSKCITGPWLVTSPNLWGIAKTMRL
jgi:hypothetical protein